MRDFLKLKKAATKVTLENDMIEDLEYEDLTEQQYFKFQDYFEANKHRKYALSISLLRTYLSALLISFSVLFIQISIDMCTPIFIRYVIEYIQKPDKDVDEGIKLVVLIFTFRFVSTVLSSHNTLQLRQMGVDAQSAISLALMAKCLKVSLQSNKQHKTGEVLNLMVVDTKKIQFMSFQLRGIVFMPLQIGVAVYMMFDFIGVSFLAGIAVILLTTIYNLYVGRKLQNNQKQLMKAKDQRTKIANELFSSIKFIKINALEQFFIDKLASFRLKEIGILKRRFIFNGLSILSVWMSPVLVVNTTFAMFIFMGNTLNAANAFAMISLFQVLQGPLLALPMIINSLIEAMISMNRLQKFLLANEIMNECIDNKQYQGPNQIALSIENGNFYWKRKGEKDTNDNNDKGKSQKDSPTQKQIKRISSADGINRESIISDRTQSEVLNKSKVDIADSIILVEDPYIPILKNIELKIVQGEFLAVVGDVGSGKSSLIQALIGEMIYEAGENQPKVCVQGSIAYVSQKSWIQNATVKENILFGQPFDEMKYHNALKYSCLTQDLETLIKGDSTMIGEKGVNLSGGQKARVSLARAIYSESDIILLDDPISAVDVHVGKFIMHKCIKGLLQKKTRVLITHALNYTQYADRVILMDNGSIVEQGTFLEIRQSERFQRIYEKFYKQTHQVQQEEEKEEDIEELELKLEKQVSNLSNQETKVHILQEKKEVVSDKPVDLIDKLMLDEDREKGTVKWEIYKKYFEMTGGVPFLLLVGLIQLVWIGSRVCGNLWLAYWTDKSDKDPDLDNNYYLGIYSSFTFMFGFLAFVRILMISLNNVSFSIKIHNQMVKQELQNQFIFISCLTYAGQCQFFERVPLGRIMNRFTKDQTVLDSEINWNVSGLYVQVTLLIANTFLNVYGTTIFMLLPIIAYFVFSWYVQRFYMHANRELYRLESISKSPILSFFSETLLGLPVVRAFQKENAFMKRHSNNLDINRKVTVQQNLCQIWFSLTLSLCSFFVNILAIVFCMFYSTANPAFAGLVMTYASSLDSNIQMTIQNLSWLETSIISFERCLNFTQVTPEPGYKQLVDATQEENSDYNEQDKYITNWPTDGQIQFKNYSVQYRSGLPNALNDLTFQINKNEKIGIVGRTGAGKSTMTLTLLRILEAVQGCIQIDGVDISKLSLKQLRESVTMIMQDATIFEGTVQENIDPLKNHTEEEVMEVIDSCCLKDLIQARDGLNTNVNEGGENLSAGEKQLICIARAVLKRSKVVLIDEATANIDIETEHKIQDTILKCFKNCTVITIAHRINTILHCDKILVIDKGTLTEFGSTTDLLKDQNSTFYGIYQEALKEQRQS